MLESSKIFHQIALLAAMASFTCGPSAAVSAEGKLSKNAAAIDKSQTLSVEVTVLLAGNDGKGIDPQVKKVTELRQPPFSAYESYVLLNKTRLPLNENSPSRLNLPNGRTLTVSLLERIDDNTIRFKAAINRPKGQYLLPLLETQTTLGKNFIVSGQSYGTGILVLVLHPTK